MDFEKKLARLETIVEKMEGGELQLEESLTLFEEGVKISRECTSQLSAAEQKVKLLMGFDEKGQPKTRDFGTESGSDD
jgi:exodeoxyribonuclease VII small subunit